jgi:hypothetical protein
VAMEISQSLIAELKELEGRLAFNVESRMETSAASRAFDTAVASLELTALDDETTAL